MIVQHSSASNEHYTPVAIIEAARAVMGGIDLDPATTADVNAETVHAAHYYTAAHDGLGRPWHGRVWLNPPGGLAPDRRSYAAVWWERLTDAWFAGEIEQAIFLGFTLEILKTTQSCRTWIGEVPLCFPSRRLAFLARTPDGLKPQKSPGHANVIAYLPPRRDGAVDRFVQLFSPLGRVLVPT